MKSNKKESKEIMMKAIFIMPIIIILLELLIAIFYQFSNIQIPRNYNNRMRFDPISSWRGQIKKKNSKKDYYDIALDKHGLAVTPYYSNDSKQNTIGILLLGNSVALGAPIKSKNNEKTFSGQLENKLINFNPKIDLINAAYYGFTSWQEHVEATRYLNSSSFHNDLPAIEIAISFGGIQDFWTLIKTLYISEDLYKNQYRYSKGWMINFESIKFSSILNQLQEGNLLFVVNFLTRGITNYWHNYSYTNDLMQTSSKKIKKIIKGVIGREKALKLRGIDYKDDSISLSLQKVIEKKFGITMDEYLKIRDLVIDSVIRNISATKAHFGEKTYIYAYAPTRMSTLDLESKESNFLINCDVYCNGVYWSLKELHILELDYRTNLLEKLKKNKSIIVKDFSSTGDNLKWFNDLTHLNVYGSAIMSDIISKSLINFIESP